MLRITIPGVEQWDYQREEFVNTKEQTLQLEHSLVSISKWESKWCKPFMTKEPKTREETIDYVRCMTITQNVDPDIYRYLTEENLKQVNAYIEAPMTATKINRNRRPRPVKGQKRRVRSGMITTSEVLYQQMIALGIPFECQKWHLNRLIMLIEVCNAEGETQNIMSQKDVLSQNAALNAARRKQLNTKG